MTPDDLIYSPISPVENLRDLVKKIMDNPTNRKILDSVSDHIVDLFARQGITDEEKIIDSVYQEIQNLENTMMIVGHEKKTIAGTSYLVVHLPNRIMFLIYPKEVRAYYT
jgi:hypothetical protein